MSSSASTTTNPTSKSSRPRPPPPSLLALKLDQISNNMTSTSISTSISNSVTSPLSSPFSSSGIIPPCGTPSSTHCPSFPSSPSRRFLFDLPYPIAPNPSPVSSYIPNDISSSLHYFGLPSPSFGSSPNSSFLLSPSMISFPPPPPNSLQTSGIWPNPPPPTPNNNNNNNNFLPPLTHSLSTSPTRSSIIKLSNPRPRRRSSLSIVMTSPPLPSSPSSSSSLSTTSNPIINIVPAIDNPDSSSFDNNNNNANNKFIPNRRIGRPRTLTADASAAATALLGTQGTVTALGATPMSDDSKVYICDDCGKLFRSSNSLAHHRINHVSNCHLNNNYMTSTIVPYNNHNHNHNYHNLVMEATKKLANLPTINTTKSTSTSSTSTGSSTPSGMDDDLVFPMHDDGPSTVA